MSRNRDDRTRGQALVEFSLAIMVFLVLMMAIFDFGRAIYQYNGVAQAAREIARVTAAHAGPNPQDPSKWTQQTKDVIATQQGMIPNLEDPEINCVEIDGNPAVECLRGKWINVYIKAPYTPITPILGLTGTWNLFSASTSVQLQ